LNQNPVFITDEVASESDKFLIHENDILITMTGTKNKRDFCFTAIVDATHIAEKKLYLNQRVGCIRIIKPVYNQLVNIFLKSPIIVDYLLSSATGTANQANIGANTLRELPFPLPPLAEQKRIVEKCDRLLSICDEIEKRHQQRQESIVRMNESAIAQLLSSQNPDDFRQHWQRICNNFDLLYSIPETIPKLRQAILQLAVQGKLTNQSSKEIKKISDTHKVSDYVSILNGYAFKSTWFINDGIRLLRNANVGHGDLRWDDVATISEERAQEFQRFKLDIDDIVISLDRPIISTGLKVARITKNDLPCLLLQRVGKFEFKTDKVIPDFFFLWLQSPIFINAIDPGRSNGVPHISSKSIEAILFNPPSREEQKRIVEKCDRLMSLCDTLEAKLKQGRDSSEKLMEVAAKQVLTV